MKTKLMTALTLATVSLSTMATSMPYNPLTEQSLNVDSAVVTTALNSVGDTLTSLGELISHESTRDEICSIAEEAKQSLYYSNSTKRYFNSRWSSKVNLPITLHHYDPVVLRLVTKKCENSNKDFNNNDKRVFTKELIKFGRNHFNEIGNVTVIRDHILENNNLGQDSSCDYNPGDIYDGTGNVDSPITDGFINPDSSQSNSWEQ